MRKIFLLCTLAFSLQSLAQNKTLGVGTTTPNPNAALDVVSPTNNQGILVPRLTTTQRTNMTLGAGDVGLIVYDLNLKSIHTWNGTAWEDSGVAQKLAIPYMDSVVTSTGGKPLIHIKHNNPNIASILYLEQIDTTNIVNPFVIQQNGKGAAMNVVQNNKLGTGGIFQINHAQNNGFAMRATSLGTGSAGRFIVNNAAGGTAVWATTNSNLGGPLAPVGIYGESTGTGSSGGAFRISNPANTLSALYSETNGSGSAITGTNIGTGNGFGGLFSVTQSSNTYPAIQASTVGTGPGVRVIQNATSLGSGMDIFIQNSSSTVSAFSVTHQGTGTGIFANHTGASGNIAVFQSGNANVARIDKTGKGFFNGGTQASGADVAEAFEVEGSVNEYEPGDVLVISETTDRTVEKSSSANSRKVVGVYATKPGVLLTEKGIDDALGNTVPMGVIGVIPTKVCLENGVIKRGDLLVSSSEKGKAMKAIPSFINGIEIYPQGAILGKALENFDGSGKGLINVLVNVK
jgi:hypothetical protein